MLLNTIVSNDVQVLFSIRTNQPETQIRSNGLQERNIILNKKRFKTNWLEHGGDFALMIIAQKQIAPMILCSIQNKSACLSSASV